ncbi:unnamed protein product [Urochloa humidicola]
MATVLMDELVEEILVRLPPDDPILPVRVALVCKQWCRRLVSGSNFRRWFREYHRTVPVLGLLCNMDGHDKNLTTKTSSASSPPTHFTLCSYTCV